jgi:hypothetical protein
VFADAVLRIGTKPSRVAAAADHIAGLLDTWPLGALIDDACETWTQGPNGHALAVLTRATEVLSPVLGWPRTVDRRWPLPDEEWMRQQLDPDLLYGVVSRGPRDGSHAVSVATGQPMAPAEPVDLPKYCRVPGDELAATLEDVLALIQSDGIVAVEFESFVPTGAAGLAAHARLRNALPSQSAMDSHGLAGLVAGHVPHWSTLLGAAPSGVAGLRPKAIAEGLIIPKLNADEEVVERGVLVWDAAYHHVYVHPAAVEVLHSLDGLRNLAEIASTVGASEALVIEVAHQLVELGAASV